MQQPMRWGTDATPARRSVLGVAALGISALALPSAVAAASEPVAAAAGDQIGFRREDPKLGVTRNDRILVFWFPASGSFDYNVTFTVTSAAAGSLNTFNGDTFTIGPVPTSVGREQALPDGRSFEDGSVLTAEFLSTTSPPLTFTRTGHVWGTDTL